MMVMASNKSRLESHYYSPVSSTLSKPMVPYVLDETLVCLFNYWNQGIQQGMRYGNELYSLFRSYSSHERSAAYALAFEESEKGKQVCITVSSHKYQIWVQLKSSLGGEES